MNRRCHKCRTKADTSLPTVSYEDKPDKPLYWCEPCYKVHSKGLSKILCDTFSEGMAAYHNQDPEPFKRLRHMILRGDGNP